MRATTPARLGRGCARTECTHFEAERVSAERVFETTKMYPDLLRKRPGLSAPRRALPDQAFRHGPHRSSIGGLIEQHGLLSMSKAKPIESMQESRPLVQIFTDGACSPNPGAGGWAALLRFVVPSTGEIIERELTGYEPQTTNNRMEIMAAIIGIEALTRPSDVTLYSDSQLLVRGASIWIVGWRERGWSRKKGGGVLFNVDLWQRLDAAMRNHRVTWEWVRGHNGHVDNERVDQLATSALRLRGLSIDQHLDVEALHRLSETGRML